MNSDAAYLANVALHAAALSIFATVLLLALRQARLRSAAAVIGMLAIGVLPWISALRPAPKPVFETRDAPIPAAVLPAWTVVTLPAQTVAHFSPAHLPAPVAKTRALPDPLELAFALWAAGACVGLLMLAFASFRLWKLKRSLVSPDDAAWSVLSSELPAGFARGSFLLCETAASPCVAGFWKPRIVIPRFLISGNARERLGWAVRHEIAHLRGGDSRWAVAFAAIRCVYWWNPLVHRLASEWSDARERVCDLQAAGIGKCRADYGGFLVAMAGQSGFRPPLAVPMARRAHVRRLKRRIVSLLDAKPGEERLAGKRFAAVCGLVFVCFAAAASVLRIGAAEPPQLPVETPATAANPADAMPAPDPALPFSHVVIATRLIEVPTDKFVRDGSIFSEEQCDMIMRSLSRIRGLGLMTTPRIVAEIGHRAPLEIIRQVPEKGVAGKPAADSPFLGVRMGMRPVASDGPQARKAERISPFPEGDPIDSGVEMQVDFDYRRVPGIYEPLRGTGKPSADIEPASIEAIKRSMVFVPVPGYWHAFDLGEIKPGGFLIMLMQANPSDSAGNESNTGKNAEPSAAKPLLAEFHPFPVVKGKIVLQGIFIERLLTSPRPRGSGMPIGLTPSDPDFAAALENEPGAKVRQIGTVEINLNDKTVPWPEFPGLCLTATASDHPNALAITSHATGAGAKEFPNVWDQLTAGSVMNFGIRTSDPLLEKRLIVKILPAK